MDSTGARTFASLTNILGGRNISILYSGLKGRQSAIRKLLKVHALLWSVGICRGL